jgi:hypothetical protein
MSGVRTLAGLALLGLLAAPAARAGEVYSYVDGDGVLHFSNVPSDGRYRKVKRTPGTSGVYRAPQARATPAPAPATTKTQRFRDHIRAAAAKYNLP